MEHLLVIINTMEIGQCFKANMGQICSVYLFSLVYFKSQKITKLQLCKILAISFTLLLSYLS